MEKGGNAPCVLNAANEVVVDAFMRNKISFLEMSDLIEQCLEKITFIETPTLQDYIDTHSESCRYVASLIKN
jgi:1-deoxy-D-xylulose-5-phosphate reductoisomerase